MKLYYATGSSSLYPHIVLHESGLAFEAIKIDEHAKEIARSRAAAGNAASAQDRSESEAAGCRMRISTGWLLEADRVDRPSEPNDAGTVDGSFWDEVTIAAKRTRQSSMTASGPFLQ